MAAVAGDAEPEPAPVVEAVVVVASVSVVAEAACEPAVVAPVPVSGIEPEFVSVDSPEAWHWCDAVAVEASGKQGEVLHQAALFLVVIRVAVVVQLAQHIAADRLRADDSQADIEERLVLVSAVPAVFHDIQVLSPCLAGSAMCEL